MDYYAWSQEYTENARSIQNTIDKLKRQKDSCTYTDRLDLESKIKRYRSIRNDLLKIADLLMRRAG